MWVNSTFRCIVVLVHINNSCIFLDLFTKLKFLNTHKLCFKLPILSPKLVMIYIIKILIINSKFTKISQFLKRIKIKKCAAFYF